MAFDPDDCFTDFTENGSYDIWCAALHSYRGHDRAFCIPEGVNCLDPEAFELAPELTDLWIPDTVEEIWDQAFCGCTALKYLPIPASVTRIEDGVFDGMDITLRVQPGSFAHQYAVEKGIRFSLPNIPKESPAEDFRIQDGVLKEYLGHAESVIIPRGVRTIASDAFCGCSELRQVLIPGTVEEIEAYAFSHSGVQTIVMMDGVKKLDYAFAAYSDLRMLVLPGSVESLSDDMLYDFEMEPDIISPKLLAELIIIESFTRPTDRSWVSVVEDSRVHEGVQFIQLSQQELDQITDWAADGFAPLARLPEGIREITAQTLPEDGCLPGRLGKLLLPLLEIPATVQTIEPEALSFWHALREVRIADGLPEIGRNAFQYCTVLKTLTIPGSVRSIGQSGLGDCPVLSKVTFNGGLPDLHAFAFHDAPMYNYLYHSTWHSFFMRYTKETHVYLSCPPPKQDFRLHPSRPVFFHFSDGSVIKKRP